jgi:putative ABC transport system substrate-binding protein
MKRRQFIVTAAAGLALPSAVSAQQSGVHHRVGMVFLSGPSSAKQFEDALREGLSELGYVIGRTLTLDVRYAEGNSARLPALVDEIIALKPNVLVGISQVARVMLDKTKTIPIVLPTAVAPVEVGLAKSLARPGGNVTGISNLMGPLAMKQIEILGEIIPGYRRVALLNDTFLPANARIFDDFARQAARVKGLTIDTHNAQSRAEIEKAFALMEKDRPDALVVAGSALFFFHRALIAENVARLRIPTIYGLKEHVEDGGLISYGADTRDGYRRSATFIDKILKGANPAELPIEQATKFELSINLKTARALGLTVPQSLLARANEVIE